MDFEKVFCSISIWTYWYYYGIAKEEYDGDGPDTKELAFDYTFKTLSSAGFVYAEQETDKRIRVTALDPATFLVFNTKTGKAELYEYILDKLDKKFGMYLSFRPYNLSDGFVNNEVPRKAVYDYTKPFILNNYGMIQDEVMSWEEAFDLKDCDD